MQSSRKIKRWTARRKSSLVLEIIQRQTTVAEASRQFDLTPAEVETWVEDGKRGMENALRAKPEGVRQVRAPAQGIAGSLWQSHAGVARPKTSDSAVSLKKLVALLGTDET